MLLVMGAVMFLFAGVSSAEVPGVMNYQGKMTTASGGCLNDTVQMTFTIYADSFGTTSEWTETQTEVIVKEGVFSVLLGSVDSPIPPSIFDGSIKYLGVQVESDPEMRPLKPMGSVAYAFNSATAAPDADWTMSGDDIYRLDGNVGVGTDAPAVKLHVTGGELQINTDQVGGYYSRIDGNEISGGTAGGPPGSHHLHIKPGDNSSNLLLAEDGGNVGIGTASPSWPLHVPSSRQYSGYFTSDYLSHQTDVIHSEYTGSGDYNAVAVYGRSRPADGYGIGGAFGGGSMGVQGVVSAEGTVITDVYMGVAGFVSGGSGSNWGVIGHASGSGTNISVYGSGDSATANYAGYFYGNVQVTGTINKGAVGFQIDHPLDPENKYLHHSGVESPDMMNVYNGNVILDARGEAVVQLPDYFEALNRDFRYQLTCIGGFAPVYIAQKISGNRFSIAGGEPDMEVSWQVTGIRHDKFAEANRIQVEVDKSADERGKYLHPRAYGLGEEYDIQYEMHKRMEEKRLRSGE